MTFRAQVAAGAQFESDDPLGEKITRFEEEIGLRVNPADVALALHRQWMAQQGKAWDDTPVAGDDRWWDQNIEYTGMEDLNRALTKKV